jgi:hypothetical protein
MPPNRSTATIAAVHFVVFIPAPVVLLWPRTTSRKHPRGSPGGARTRTTCKEEDAPLVVQAVPRHAPSLPYVPRASNKWLALPTGAALGMSVRIPHRRVRPTTIVTVLVFPPVFPTWLQDRFPFRAGFRSPSLTASGSKPSAPGLQPEALALARGFADGGGRYSPPSTMNRFAGLSLRRARLCFLTWPPFILISYGTNQPG